MSRMNSLVSYESDDDIDDSPDEKLESFGSLRNYRKPTGSGQDDTNYDEVQMSLSEDSDDSNYKYDKEGHSRDRDRNDRSSPKDRDKYRNEERSRYRDRDREDGEKSKNGDRVRSDRERYREEKDDDRSARERREEPRQRSRSRSRERSSNNRDDRYNRDRRDRNDRRRSKSRERRRSRSPRRRSRSRSRDRGNRGGYYKRYDRGGARYDNRNEKSDNQLDTQPNTDNQPKDRFYMPGITGKFREQIEKRKLLWQKNKEPEKPETVTASGPSKGPKVWETTTFAQDSDGKVANKFKRLMGIRNAGEGKSSGTEVLKKQEEMFSSMEAQYEVARTATHTMRGVGLGFGSYQR